MPKTTSVSSFSSELASIELGALGRVVGGVNTAAWQQAQQAAQPYCPNTVAKYAGVNPSTLTRAKAQQIGNACLTEMGPFDASFARGQLQGAINKAFPR